MSGIGQKASVPKTNKKVNGAKSTAAANARARLQARLQDKGKQLSASEVIRTKRGSVNSYTEGNQKSVSIAVGFSRGRETTTATAASTQAQIKATAEAAEAAAKSRFETSEAAAKSRAEKATAQIRGLDRTIQDGFSRQSEEAKRYYNSTTNQLQSGFTKISTDIRDSESRLQDNILQLAKLQTDGLGKLNSLIVDLDKRQQENILRLYNQLQGDISKVMNNQKLSANAINANIKQLADAFGGQIASIKGDLGAFASGIGSALSDLGGQLATDRANLNAQLADQKGMLDALSQKAAEDSRQKAAEAAASAAASELEAQIQTFMQTGDVLFCPSCKGSNHAADCMVTNSNLTINYEYQRTVPYAIIQAINKASGLPNLGLKSDVVGGKFRLQHNRSDILPLVDTANVLYAANPRQFILDYCFGTKTL